MYLHNQAGMIQVKVPRNWGDDYSQIDLRGLGLVDKPPVQRFGMGAQLCILGRWTGRSLSRHWAGDVYGCFFWICRPGSILHRLANTDYDTFICLRMARPVKSDWTASLYRGESAHQPTTRYIRPDHLRLSIHTVHNEYSGYVLWFILTRRSKSPPGGTIGRHRVFGEVLRQYLISRGSRKG